MFYILILRFYFCNISKNNLHVYNLFHLSTKYVKIIGIGKNINFWLVSVEMCYFSLSFSN